VTKEKRYWAAWGQTVSIGTQIWPEFMSSVETI